MLHPGAFSAMMNCFNWF